MKKLLNLLLVFFTSIVCHTQSDTSFQLIKIIRGDIVDFTVDNRCWELFTLV